MKIWVDDWRPAPTGYFPCESVEHAITTIEILRNRGHKIEVLDLDHDAGPFAAQGGDYIEILNWMEQEGINDIPIHIHSMNIVGRKNMEAICKRNGWTILT